MCIFTPKLLALWPEEEVTGPEKQDDGGGFGGSDWAAMWLELQFSLYKYLP